MQREALVSDLGLEHVTPTLALAGPALSGGYVSDLLSDVLGHAPRHGVLITVQTHLNVVAVAVHAELGAVVFANGRRPEAAVVARAVAEGVPLFVSGESAFDVAGKLYARGLRGPTA